MGVRRERCVKAESYVFQFANSMLLDSPMRVGQGDATYSCKWSRKRLVFVDRDAVITLEFFTG